jgi:hypothetical protein
MDDAAIIPGGAVHNPGRTCADSLAEVAVPARPSSARSALVRSGSLRNSASRISGIHSTGESAAGSVARAGSDEACVRVPDGQCGI